MVGSLLISFYYYSNVRSDSDLIGEVTGYMLKPKKRIELVGGEVPSVHSRVPLYSEDGRLMLLVLSYYYSN